MKPLPVILSALLGVLCGQSSAAEKPSVLIEVSDDQGDADGGLKHGQHLAFNALNNYPLANLHVTMLQRLGLEAGKFASSTGTMRGLEMA